MLIGEVFNNTSIMKDSQTVLVSDVYCIRSCAYMHIQKLYVNHPDCNLWGNIEVKEIMELMKLVVEGEEGGERKHSVNTHTQHMKIISVGIR